MEADMKKKNARNLLDNEAFMMDLFIAIVKVMDLDPDIKDGWLNGLKNHKKANKQFVEEADDKGFDDLVAGELALLAKLKAQIPYPPSNAYEKAWLDNITSDEEILKNM